MSIFPSFAVQMDIHDILYLSWLIPEKRLQPAIPAHMHFALTHEGQTIISIVIFRSKNVVSSFFPFLHFSYNQANIRAYVIDPVSGMPAVFFIKSGITSPFVSFVTGLLKIPWNSISMCLDVRYKNDHLYQYHVEGNWEEHFNIELKEDFNPLDPAPFQNLEEAARFLTCPAVGFYGRSEKLIRFEVNHSAIKPSNGRLISIQCPILVNSGLIINNELETPNSILIAPYGHFTVFMPPAMISIQ
ncbi:MAG: DUF2071 domain-containing protein [Proteobacteria bacterium]|nr:DUF2071 domain-containing protein [Pseudomonadota bacterium]